jgi:hypothetical protein
MNIGKFGSQDLMKLASTAFAVYSVVKTIRIAREDKDGLQLIEAVLRGATVTMSVIIIVRNMRELGHASTVEAGDSPA